MVSNVNEEQPFRHSWEINPDSSFIEFSLRFHEIGLIKAHFAKFTGEIEAGNKFDKPEIRISIVTNSVSTFNKEWDRKLRSKVFMSANEFPVITFISKNGWRSSKGGIQELTGQLRLKSRVDIIRLLVTSAVVKQTSETQVAKFTMTTSLSLADYGFGNQQNEFGKKIDLNIVLVANIKSH